MPNWVWWFILLAIVAGLLKLAKNMDPGLRSGDDPEVFDCLIQHVILDGQTHTSRWHPARAAFEGFGHLRLIERRRAVKPWAEYGRRLGGPNQTERHTEPGDDALPIVGRSPNPPKGRSVYVVGEGGTLFAVSVTRDSPADRRLAITLPD